MKSARDHGFPTKWKKLDKPKMFQELATVFKDASNRHLYLAAQNVVN